MKNFNKYLLKTLILSLLIPVSGWLLADARAEFNQSFATFAKHAQAGDLATGLPHAKKVYELSKTLFSEGSSNRLNAAENYALTLKQLSKDSDAEPVLLDMLQQQENTFGKYASELETTLSDLAALDLSDTKKEAYHVRFEKIHLRHNSSEYVQQLTSSNLDNSPLAIKIKEAFEQDFDSRLKIYETAHWNLITVGKSDKYTKKTNALLEKIYRSMLSFRIALDIPPSKLKEKLVAVYFENHAQRQKFTKNNKRLNGQYAVLVLAQNNQAFPVTNTTRNTIQLIANASGLERKVKGKPAWVFNGLYDSFKFADDQKEFGPHTDNYQLRSIVAINKIIAKSKTPTVNEIVSYTGGNLPNNRQIQLTEFYPYFIRYLYEFYPEPLGQFFYAVSSRNSKRTASAYRAKFEDVFGDIETHEEPFKLFIQKIIKEGEQKIAANKK